MRADKLAVPAGRNSTEALTISVQTYTVSTNYDVAGQVSGYTYADGKVVGRTYDDRGQLATLVYDGTTIDTRAYDDGGRMTSSCYSSGISESITGTMSGYGFDVGGSGYDNEDRLVNWQRSDSNLNQAWNLSLVGDWTSITENATSQNRTHGPTHELVSVASQSVTHDAKGNMTLIPVVLRPSSSSLPSTASRLTWDFENKLLAADIDSTVDVFYKFDALGRRVARHSVSTGEHTVYFQSGQQTIADYTAGTAANSPTYSYVYASYIDEPVMRASSGGSVKHYFHRNQQYSITALTDGSGTIVERYAYTAYGELTITDSSGTLRTASAVNNRYTYTAREWDSKLALYHYRARMYDSLAGRFCGRDPIGYHGSEWNLYEYVNANPLSGLDSEGLCATTCQDRDGTSFEINQVILKNRIDIELRSNIKGTETTGDVPRFVRKSPLNDTDRLNTAQAIFKAVKAKVICCLEKNGDVSLIDSEETEYTRKSDSYKTITLHPEDSSHQLSRSNMGSYFDYAYPVPVWQYSAQDEAFKPSSNTEKCMSSYLDSFPKRTKKDTVIK
jgi:RHS repeat-associated protein